MMCGFAGIFSFSGKGIPALQIEAATEAVSHRGPDGKGYWINKESTVALGHQRLCIIDLSDKAAQPLCYESRYSIVYNGELYNYLELKAGLQRRGFSFQSASDTEVLVAAYAAYGKECLQYFDGMFSFIIWDEEEKKLFAARDRFGEKPLFFYHDKEQLVIASEIKAIAAAGIQKKVNEAMLYNFITIGYTTNPAHPGQTFFTDIQKLPPSFYLTCQPSEGKVEIEKYWQVELEEDHSITEKEAADKLVCLLKDSVRKRLRSDVGIGTSLSGGLDSSFIVALCYGEKVAQYTHAGFTAAFAGFEKDEWQKAALVAQAFGIHHHRIEIRDEEVPALMKTVMELQEEPIASASALAQYKVYEGARQLGVKVLLDGQGADEVFGGYPKYFAWYWQELYRQNRQLFFREVKSAKALGVNQPFGPLRKVASLFPHFAAAIQQGKKQREAARHPFLDRDFAFRNQPALHYSLPAQLTLNGVLYYNTFVNGLEELLRLADRNSMAHGLEVRLPFLQHELVSFLFTLPAHFKIKDGYTKWILRSAASTFLPKEVIWQGEKIGFEPPQKQWMQQPAVLEAIRYGKKSLVEKNILDPLVLTKKEQPHHAYAAAPYDWRYWAASILYEQEVQAFRNFS